jgi:hypothetical protein
MTRPFNAPTATTAVCSSRYKTRIVNLKWIEIAVLWKVIWLAAAISLAHACQAGAESPANSACLECHGDNTLATTNAGKIVSLYVSEKKFAASVHHVVLCNSCHNDITSKHPDDNRPAAPVDCARCHAAQSFSYGLSIHGTALPKGEQQAPNCVDCHDSHEEQGAESPSSPLYFSNLAKTCGQCHPQEAADVQASVHGKATALGHRDAASCTDCHSEHKIESLRLGSALKISQDGLQQVPRFGATQH